MSLLDFDGDEDWDRHLARLARRKWLANIALFLFLFLVGTSLGLLIGTALVPNP